MYFSESDKFDIVIQGKYYDFTDDIVECYLKVPFLNKIIISCWEDNREPLVHDRVCVIKNRYPETPGTDNRNLQILSSLNGLKKCDSNFAIKIRSDQKYTLESMLKMFEFFHKNKKSDFKYQYNSNLPNNRIFVLGFFHNLLFSPRDHVFWGNTRDLIDLFNIPLEKNGLIDIINVSKENLWKYYDNFIRSETYIGCHYCARFDDSINRMILNQSEYLYDYSPKWEVSKKLSDDLTFKVFKSFPKNIIDFQWLGKTEYNIPGIPWTLNPYLEACSWHEEGY